MQSRRQWSFFSRLAGSLVFPFPLGGGAEAVGDEPEFVSASMKKESAESASAPMRDSIESVRAITA